MEILDLSNYRPKKIPSPQLREGIKEVWEVAPLSCQKCGSEMKIINFINETDFIRKSLEHLLLWEIKIPTERAPSVSTLENSTSRMTTADRNTRNRKSRFISLVFKPIISGGIIGALFLRYPSVLSRLCS